MANEAIQFLLRYARQLADAEALVRLSDGGLLDRFARHGDDAAFAVLAERYAALVLGACRRLLRSEQDVEDAFQATFLVLARKARALNKHRRVGGWLHTVAYRIALKARADAARRRSHETQAAVECASEGTDHASAKDDCSLLDEELQRLPEKYRLALVLCYLQGKTNAQAASELGWRAGSMSRRLARGRELLRRALTRRGVQVPAGLLSAAAVDAARGAPIRLLAAAVEAARAARAGGLHPHREVLTRASAWAEAVLQETAMKKVRWLAGAILAVGLAGGIAVGQRDQRKAEGGAGPPAAAPTGKGKDGEPSPESYYKVFVEVEARGRLTQSAKGATVTTVLRLYQSFTPAVERKDEQSGYELPLDFSRSPELQELAKTLAGKEVVVNGLSELRLVGQPSRPFGYSGPNPPPFSMPTPSWTVHPTVLVTRLRTPKG